MDSALQRVYADVFGTEASELDAAAWPERCIPGLTFPTVPGLVLHKQTLDTDQQGAAGGPACNTAERVLCPARRKPGYVLWSAAAVGGTASLASACALSAATDTRPAPSFDQLAVNRYVPGEGLKQHVDLPHRFDDGVLILSLGAPAVMRFTAAACQPGPVAARPQSALPAPGPTVEFASVLLEPGDCLLLTGAARYDVMHGFDAVKAETHEGQRVTRGVRTSVTLRKMRSS